MGYAGIFKKKETARMFPERCFKSPCCPMGHGVGIVPVWESISCIRIVCVKFHMHAKKIDFISNYFHLMLQPIAGCWFMGDDFPEVSAPMASMRSFPVDSPELGLESSS